MSPISSRNSVPPFAYSKRPLRWYAAPVKAPFSCPKSSLSTRCGEIAPQLTGMKRLLRRRLFSCSARANSSLPVPLSPTSKTATSVSATSSIFFKTRCSAALLAMMPSNPNFWSKRRLRSMLASLSSRASSARPTLILSPSTLSGLRM